MSSTSLKMPKCFGCRVVATGKCEKCSVIESCSALTLRKLFAESSINGEIIF